MSAILSVSSCKVSVMAVEFGMDGRSITLNKPSSADVVPSGSWCEGAAVLRRFAGGVGRPQPPRL